VPGLVKVRRYKLIQLQGIAGGEDQMVEVTDILEKTLNVLLLGEIERVSFSFPVERCDGLSHPVGIARCNDCRRPLRHNLLRQR
jgi:hypothetical protein